MKSIKILALIITMLTGGFVFAEEKEIEKVREVHGYITSNDEALPFATILIGGTTMGASSDADGHFHIHNIPTGDITLIVSAVGYKSAKYTIAAGINLPENVVIDLEETIISTDEVVVSASRNTVKRKDAPVLVNTIGIQLLENVQAISLVEGLNFTPGLRVENDCQNCGFTQVRLNGLEGSYSQILINSRPIFSTMAGVYGLEQLPINMIDKIEVVRGGGSSLFGSNAIGGTINIITKDPLSNQYTLGSNFGLINGEAPELNVNASASVTNDHNSSGIFLYGNVRRRDHWDANNDGYSELTEIKANNMGLRAYYRPGNYSKINLDFGATKEFRRGGNRFDEIAHNADITEQVDHNILNGGITFDQYSKDSKNKLSIYTSGQYVDRGSYYGAERDPSAYGQTYDIAAVAGIQETHYWNDFLGAKSTTTGGAEYLYGSLNDNKLGYYNAEEDIYYDTRNITDQFTYTLAAYLQNEWNWTKFKLLLGLRYDQVTVDDHAHKELEKETYPNWSPRVNLVYKPNEHLSIRGNVSTGFRAPQIFSEDLHIESSGARTIIHINDPSLDAEKSISFTGGLDYDFQWGKAEFEVIAEAFYTHLKNPFAPSYEWDEENKILYDIRVNAEDGAIVEGVNIEFNWSYDNKMDMQSGFTYQSSKWETPQAWGEMEESISAQMTRTPDAYGYLVYTYYPSRFFSGSLNMNYTGPMQVPHFLEDGSEELVHTQGFLDLGVKLAYKFMIGDMTFLELSGGVKNIFNSYQDDFDRGINRDAGYVYGPGLPRTYFIGLELRNFL